MQELNLRKYYRSFFLQYILYYILGITIFLTLDNFYGLKLHDIILIGALCMAIPPCVAKKFQQKEGRLLTEEEQEKIAKASTLIAWVVSLIYPLVIMLYPLLIKLSLSPEEGTTFATQHLNDHFLNMVFKMPTIYYVGLIFGMIAIYYIGIKYTIHSAFKRAAVRLKKL